MSWLLNDMLGAEEVVSVSGFLSGIYDRYPLITGSSPIMINQSNSLTPTGYEQEGFISESFGSDDLYRKDINGMLENIIDNTQKFSYRFLSGTGA